MAEPISAKRPPDWQPEDPDEGRIRAAVAEPQIRIPQPRLPQFADANPIGALGELANVASEALQWYNFKVPQRILGEMARPGPVASAGRSILSRSLGMTPIVGPGLPMLSPLGAFERPDVQAVYAAQGPQAAWDYVAENYLPLGTVQQMVMESAVDPLSYTGFGLAGKAAGALGRLAPQAGRAASLMRAGATALQGVERADQVVARVLGAPVEGPLRAGRWLYGKTPLSHPPARAKLSEFADRLKDAVGEVRSLGYRYRSIETGGDPLLGAWPGSSEAANAVERQAWAGLEAKVQKMREPLARFRAFQAKQYAQEATDQWGQEAAGETLRLRDLGAPAGEVADVWQTRHRRVMQMIRGLDDVIDEFEAATPVPSTPAQTQRAGRITATLNRDVQNLTRQARQDLETTATSLGLTPGSVEHAQLADQIFRQRNQGIRARLAQGAQEMEDLYFPGARAAGGPTFPDTESWRGVQNRLSELQSLAGGLPSFIGRMSDERGQTLSKLLPSFDRYAAMVDRDRNKVLGILTAVAGRVPGFRIPTDLASADDALRALRGVAQPFEVKQVESIVRRWSDEGLDLLADDPLDLVSGRIIKDQGDVLGVRGLLPHNLNLSMKAWVEQALVSARFPLMNVISQLVMGQLKGVSAARILRNLSESVPALVRTGKVEYPGEVRRALSEYEQRLPQTVEQGGIVKQLLEDRPLVRDLIREAEPPTAMEQIHPVVRAGVGAAVGAGSGPVGAVVGAVGGLAMPKLVATNRLLGRSIESTARTTAWLKGKDDYVRTKLPGFLKELRAELQRGRPQVLPSVAGLGAAATPQMPGESDEGYRQRVSLGLLGAGLGAGALATVRGGRSVPRRGVAQISLESAPGQTSGFLSEYHRAPLEEQQAFHDELQSILRPIRHRLLTELGLAVGKPFNAPGLFKGQVSPGSQVPLRVGAAGQRVDEVTARKISAWAAVEAKVTRQDAAAWTLPYHSGVPEEENATQVILGRTVTPAETAALNDRLAKALGEDGVAIIPTQRGALITNVTPYNDAIPTVDNIAFQARVRGVLDEVQFEGNPTTRANAVATQGDYIENDWRLHPNGEGYLGRISQAGRPDLFRRFEDLLSEATTPVYDRWAARWRQPSGAQGATGSTPPLSGTGPAQPLDPGLGLLAGPGVRFGSGGALRPVVPEALGAALGGGAEYAYTDGQDMSPTERAARIGAAAVGGAALGTGARFGPLSGRLGAAAWGPVPPVTSAQVQNVERLIRATNGRMGPRRLAEILTANGAPIDVVHTATKRWMNVLAAGDRAGEALSTKINFDYSKTDNFEEFFRYLGPFVIWPKRAIPFFLETLAEHPGFIVAMNRYYDLSEDDTRGLPARYRNMVSAGPVGDRIASLIAGRPVKGYVNPLSVVLPFADIGAVGEEDNPALAARRLMGDVGLGLAPWADIPATLLGAYGEVSYPRIFRHTGLLQGLTGRDPELPIREGLANVQEAITGTSGSQDWTDWLVRRRLAEKSVEETGRVRAEEYQAAMRDPRHPLYQAALAELQREQAGRAVSGMVNPLYIQGLGETEQQAREALARVKEAQQTPAKPPPLSGTGIGDRPVQQMREELRVAGYPNWEGASEEEIRQVYARTAVPSRREAIERQREAIAANPLAETYGRLATPISASELHGRLRGYRTLRSASERTAFFRIVDRDGWAARYLAWRRDQGKEGDIGDLTDVQRFLATRG